MFRLPIYLKNKKYDFILLPAANKRQMFYYPHFTIATLHDLADFYISNKFNIILKFYINFIIPFFLKKCDFLLTISESTKKDVLKFYNFKEKKMKVVYDGYNSKVYNTNRSQKSIIQKVGIDKDYILYISRIEHPRKNHLNLMKAYEKLPKNIKENYDLVFVGKMSKNSDEIIKYADKSLDRNRIKFLGFVESKYLPALYRDSSLFIYPSYHEGFGIPLIEAMACGVPVICSNRSSLPEVGGDAVQLIDPDDSDDIAESITRVLVDEKLKDKLIGKGFERVKKFSWENHVNEIIEIYIRNKRKPDSQLTQ